MRFTGTIEGKTDEKGRVFFPAVFRRVLQAVGEEQLVLRRDVFEPCLVLYPQSVWNARVDALQARLGPWQRDERRVLRRFVSDAEVLTPDQNGRILLPARYREMAAIEQEVVFLGLDNTVELWSKQCLAACTPSDEDFARSLELMMAADDGRHGKAEP